MTVLALDCGNKTGWARSVRTGSTESGVVDFTPKPNALVAWNRWSRFVDWLDQMLDNHVRLVVYERWTNAPGIAAKISAGFITRVEERCDALGVERLEVSPAELKLWLTGKGNASKDEMTAEVLKRGWVNLRLYQSTDKAPPVTSDEADALALLHFALEKHA